MTKKSRRNPCQAYEVYHHLSTHIGLGCYKALGKITLSEAYVVMKSFDPWKDLSPKVYCH